MKSILDNWVALQQVWDESLDGNLEPEIKSSIIGDYFWLFLWSNYITISFKTPWWFIQNTSKVFSYSLSGKRNCWFDTADHKFTPIRKWIWIALQKTVQQAEVLEITQPSLPPKRKRPAKLLKENEALLYDEASHVKTFYRRIYFDAIDTGTNCIKTRFSQPAYWAIRNIEQLILNVINGFEDQNQLEHVLSDYSEEINQYRLSTQLQILKTKFVD